jgi:adenosylcobinamide-phosphate synthase
VENVIILLLALAIDLTVGEYLRPLHPVVGMGKVASLGLRVAPRWGRWAQLTYGAGVVILTMALFALPAYFLLSYLEGLNTVAYVVVAALLLKSTFSLKELWRVALRVKRFLEGGNLSRARVEMKALVSRDTSQLGEPHLVSATVESVAENTSDSFVAPLFYFLLFGVPGAIAYRVVNTLDAMIGYHGEYEYLGKVAARLDDGLNFLPARLSGLLIVVAAYLCRKDGNNAWQVMLGDHGNTRSLNAGWPMSATAGALRARLEKVGHYSLGSTNNPLSPQLILPGVRLMGVSALLWVILCLMVGVMTLVFSA